MKRNLMIVIAFLLLFSMQMSAQTFSAQGVLRDVLGKTVDDGSYQLNFKLYEQASGGTEIWSETQSNVEIIHGVFSIELGSVTSLDDVPFDTTYWVGVAVAGGTEMTPRLKLTRAPSAMSLYSSANVIPLIGNIGIGTHDPEAALHIKTSDDTYDKLLIEGADGTDYIKVTGDGKMALNVENPTQALDMDGNIKVRSGGIIFADSSILRSADMGGAASAISNAESAPIIADADEDGAGTIDLNIGDSTKVRIHNDGNTAFYGDLTANKITDSDDASYFVDPNSNSSLYLLGVNGDTATTGYPLSVAGDIRASKIDHPDNTFYIDPNSVSKFPTKLCLGGANSFSHTLVVQGDINRKYNLYTNSGIYYTSLWDRYSWTDPVYTNGIVPPIDNHHIHHVMIGGDGPYSRLGLTIIGTSPSMILKSDSWDDNTDQVTLYWTRFHSGWSGLDIPTYFRARFGEGLEIQHGAEYEFNLSDNFAFQFHVSGGGRAYFEPHRNNHCYLGTSSLYWNELYTYTLYRGTEYTLSDRRVKRNIEDLSNSLDKLLALHGVRYEINRATHPFYKDRTLRKAEELPVKLGFIAQELQDVIPEMVEFNDDYNLYTIRNYEQMLPVVVAAVQELKAAKDKKIATLKDHINLLLDENRQLVKRVDNLEKN